MSSLCRQHPGNLYPTYQRGSSILSPFATKVSALSLDLRKHAAKRKTLTMDATAPAAAVNSAAATEDTVTAVEGLASMPYGERYKAARLEVPAFTGKPDYTAEAFLIKLKTAFSTYGLSPSDWVRFALSRFEAEATKFQVELTAELPAGQELTFDELEHKLLARFPVPPGDSAPYFLMHKLHLGDNLSRYLSHFNREVSRLGTGELAKQALLQEIFLSALGGDLRQLVEQARPENGWTDLTALQQATVRVQNTLHLHKPSKPSGSNSSQGSGQQKRANQQGSNPAKRGRFAPSQKAQSNPNQEPYCPVCDSNSHPVEECWTVQKRKDRAAGSGQGGGRGRGLGRRGPNRGQSSKN